METKPDNSVSHKRRLEGTVVRRSGDKTVSVEVAYKIAHPAYGKRSKRTKRYLAHDAANSAEVGQTVVIQESRPLSRHKRWTLVENKKSEK